MRRRTLAFVVGIVAGACGGGSKNTPPPSEPVIANRQPAPEPHEAAMPAHGTANERALAMMNAFAEKFCACGDSQCVERVSGEMTTWAQDMASHDQTDPMKMSEDEQKVATQIATRMGECMQRAMATGGNAPPPPTP